MPQAIFTSKKARKKTKENIKGLNSILNRINNNRKIYATNRTAMDTRRVDTGSNK